MAWVVDTSVLLDIHSADPAFSQASAECLAKHSAEGLVLSPATYVELAPAFAGHTALQEQFLAEVGVEWPGFWTLRDTQAAHGLWAAHIEKRHSGHTGKRPVADVLIEAFAQRFQGLITRNPKHFTSVPVVVP
jgi:predicted nucleic acid-binding protein